MKYKLLSLFLIFQLAALGAPRSAQQQAAHLQAILRQADRAYFERNEPLMSDAAYDALREQYRRLIAAWPELAEAPAVGSPPAAAGKTTHRRPVLSLQKAYSDEAVRLFLENCGSSARFCIEPKIDGLTVVLTYRNGLLSRALTRGDGRSGTDVTAAILASRAVPALLESAPELLEVRGELFISQTAFDALNRRRIAEGKTSLKSPRNTAAGSLRLSDYAELAARRLEIRIFELLATDYMPDTHTRALARVRATGLPVIESRTVEFADVLPAVDELNRRRAALPFPVDGIVIRVDRRDLFEQLGATAHHPRGALARKYRQIPVETRLLDVEWRRAESGRWTPVARFSPVEIQGATVERATLHNLDHLRAMDLKIGDWIQVIRAGGTVPEIIGICPGRRTGGETPIPAHPAG